MEYGGSSSTTTSGDNKFKEFFVSGDASFALKRANIYYAGQFVIFAILQFIMYNTGYTWIGKIIETVYTGKQNIGSSLVARTSSSLCFWYLIHAIITIGNKNLIDSWQFMFHTQFKWVHTLLYIGLWVGFWFIPDPFFDGFLKAAMYISCVYLVIQMLFLVFFFHEINDKYVDPEKICWPLTFSIIFIVGTLVALGVSYYLFGMSGCSANIAVITVNLILVIVMCLGGLLTERGSLLTASLVSVYVAYITVVALMCGSDCNRLASTTSSVWLTVIASIFTLVWASYSAYSTTYRYDICTCGCDCQCCSCLECCSDQEESIFSLSFFHFTYALASCYLSMVITGWGTSEGNMAAWSVDRGVIARWANLAAGWVCVAFYLWTLAAPYVLKDREFD